MRWKFAILLMVSAQLAWADATIQQAQEALKAQGYYYGQITGEKNADTAAAIRRFQIRNGLQVTGELNDETLRALNSDSAVAVATATPASAEPRTGQSVQPEQRSDDLRDEIPPQPPATAPRIARPLDDSFAQPPPGNAGGVFAQTPYSTAPAQLQREILAEVETSLRRRGLYQGATDGLYGPELQVALRNYQSRIGLPPTGRLDMETLASLGLLPGQHGPRAPRRWFGPRPMQEPPVRGEWIH
ncbi:MAG: peptidoglycan-binding protein [Verrucomicrobia bacterium]|nr:peptidoglycan-binding protein [Verrucomicrobiota bacterium]